MLWGNNMHIMTQSLKRGDGPHLPHGLSVANMYTKVISRSRWVAVVVQNLLVIPVTITKGVKVTQVIAVNAVPQFEVASRTLEELDEVQGMQQPKMSNERREVLFQQLDSSGPERCSKENKAATCAPVSWVPWHFLLGAERTMLYQPSKTWNQSCWWWTL